jgi:hypothetical protein
MRFLSVVCAVLVGFSFASVSQAQAPPRDVATARKLANSGIDAFEAGDCTRALELLERAQTLHAAPVHLQYMARCYKKQGRWVLATEAWRQILRVVGENDPKAFQTAAAEARKELPGAEAQLGNLTLRVTPAASAKVLLDGKSVAAATFGVPQVVDPGDHELVVSAPGHRTKSQSFQIEPKATLSLDVVLEKAAPGGEAAEPKRAAVDASKAGGGTSTLGVVLAVGGGAALIGGTVALLSRNSKRSELQDDCPGGQCRFASESEFRDRKASVEDLTLATNVLFIAGGALAATGVTLLVIGSGSEERSGAEVAVRAAPGSAGVSLGGRF